MPGGPIAGFIYLPIALLAGVIFWGSRPCKFCLIGWVLLYTGAAIYRGIWTDLLFPLLIIVFWVVMSEVKGMFKD